MARSLKDRASLSRRAGRVQRYHTQFLIRPETVAEHTFGVLNLLYIMMGGQVSYRLVTAALFHDMGEYITGDIPSPTKRRLEEASKADIADLEEKSMLAIHPHYVEEMTQQERAYLKLADQLDGLMKCYEEVRMGNFTMLACGRNYCSYVADAIRDMALNEPARILCSDMIDLWEKLNRE